MPEYKKKKFYYYTAEIQGLPPMQANLEMLLKTELLQSRNAIDTRMEYTEGCYRLIGYRYSPNFTARSFIAIRLMSYEAGNKAQAFDKALSTPNIPTQAVNPPNENSEFLEGIVYIFIHGNNIVISFSSSFRETAVQDYLNWILFQRNGLKGILLLNRGMSKKEKHNIENIKEFEFVAIPDFIKQNNTSTTKGLNDLIVKGATKSNNSLVIASLIDERPITMFTGYRINQRIAGNQASFDEFINKILRNIDPSLDWKITTKDKVLTRDDIIVTNTSNILAIDSIIDDMDIFEKMHKWYQCLLEQRYI